MNELGSKERLFTGPDYGSKFSARAFSSEGAFECELSHDRDDQRSVSPRLV
jgi:hypothetical protein